MEELLMIEYFIDPSKRLFWVYILSSTIIAFIYLYFYKKERRINLSKKLWLHPSAVLDYKYFFISYFIKVAIIFPVIISAKEISIFVYEELSYHFDYVNINLSYEIIISLYTISLFLISDFTRYWLHRLLHTIPFFWEFHKVHHSAKVLTPITFYRVHPIENILFGFRYSFSIGLVTGIFIYLFGAKVGILEILGVNFFLFIFSLMGSNLRHSHIKIKYPKILEVLFISPYQHQIHHSRNYTNKNFGGYLGIWDFIFGTIKYSNEIKKITFGVFVLEYKSLIQILFTPFIKLGEKYAKIY